MLGLYYEMTVGLTSDQDINAGDDPILMKRRSILLKPLIDSDQNIKKAIKQFVIGQKERDSSITAAPITWVRLSSGCRIVEFQVDRLQDAFDLLKEYYFKSHSFKVPNLYVDRYTIHFYQQFVCSVVSNGNSFCAIEEGTGELIGVLLANILSDTADLDDFSDGEEGADLTPSDLFNVLKLEKALLLKANVLESCRTDVYNCIHCICVNPNFNGRGVGTALVQACLNKLQKGDIPVCVGIFPVGASQTVASRLGFETIAEVPWLHVKEARKNVYCPASQFEMTLEKSCVACMCICIRLDSDEGEEEEGMMNESNNLI